MRIATLSLAGFLVSLGPVVSSANDKFEPDYYVVMRTCKILGAPLYQVSEKDDPMPILATQGLIQACERKPKRRVACITTFDDPEAKPVAFEYKVDVESATMTA